MLHSPDPILFHRFGVNRRMSNQTANQTANQIANQTFRPSPLDDPLRSPLQSIHTIKAGPILVVAPHPDDETLGCGGAIAALRSIGLTVQVLVMSDGTKSHPNSRAYPAPKLRALRESETRCAMSLLGVDASQITFLRLPDGALPVRGTLEFEIALAQCCDYLSSGVPAVLFVPWRFDPHPDHRATWHLIHTALSQLNSGVTSVPRVIEYPIWDWDMAQRQASKVAIASWRLDISETVQLKQRAIAAYRSQTTSLIDDDPKGFCLTLEMLANFAQPWELYFEEI